MDTEQVRQALAAELERATAKLGGAPDVDAAGREQPTGSERLAGYRDGLEFALALISPAPAEPTVVEEVAGPAPGRIMEPEPELIDKVERVRDTEV